MSFTKTKAFASGTGGTVERLNQGQNCAIAIVEGTKSIERLVRYAARSTATGATSDYDVNALAVSPAIGVSELLWNGAADVTFRGFLAGYDGEERIVRNITASKILLVTTEDTADLVAANRVLCASSFGQYLGANGVGRLTYDGTAARWRFSVIDPGAPITPTFSAGDYVNWTVGSGNVTACRFQQHGKKLTVWLTIVTASATGGTSTLQRVIPGGFTCANSAMCGVAQGVDNSSATLVFADTVTTALRFSRIDGVAWAASVSTTLINGVFQIEVL